MRATSWLALLVLATSAGCSVASLDDAELSSPKNHCQSEADCSQGSCSLPQGVCVANDGQFSTVLFEVSTPATTKEFGGIRFIKTLEQLASSGGVVNLELDVVSTVSGSVSPTRGSHQDKQACDVTYAGSSKVPVKITLTPSERLLGLQTQAYVAETVKQADNEFGFSLKVPAGVYDLYVEPDKELAGAGASTSCSVVPQLLKKLDIAAGAITLPLVAQPPSLLKLKVEWPTPDLTNPLENALASLEGWTVDVIDPSTGLLLSVPGTLAQTGTSGEFEIYEGQVEYAPVVGEGSVPGKELVRLRPAAGVVAPTIVLEQGTLDAFGVGEALINNLGGVPQAVSIVDSPVQSADGKLVAGTTTLKFVAKKLSFLESGTLFAFERTVEATEGKFNVDLLPGEYDVFISPPPASGLATTRTTLDVAKQPLTQTGKTLTVSAVSKVSGIAFSPGGAILAGASVYAVASPVLVDPLLLAANTAPFTPLSDNSVVEADGRFIINADPGTFDFYVRPEDRSGFAWFIRPNMKIQNAAHDLGSLSLALPIAFTGAVSVPGLDSDGLGRVVVPGALVRAYVYLTDTGYTSDPKQARSVLQVAETRAGTDGTFSLLLPSRLN